MKIAIISPPITDFYSSSQRITSLGLKIIKDRLSDYHECFLYDFPSIPTRHSVSLPAKIGYLREFIIENEKSPVSFFSSYFHFGPPINECVKMITGGKPDLILIGVFAFAYADSAIDLCNELKTQSDVPVIMGGAGVSVHPDFFKINSSADFLFCGEADDSINSVVDFVRGKTGTIPPGLNDCKGNNDDYIKAPPCNSFNAPFTAVNFRKLLKISVMLSRGCPLKCSFCANSITLGKKFRIGDFTGLSAFLKTVSHDSVILNFEDDNISADPGFLTDFLEELHNINPGIRIIFENGIDYRLLSGDMLVFLINHGLVQANFSLGTATNNSDGINRTFLPEKLHTLLKICSGRNIPAVTYFIAGLPGDSASGISDTVALLSSWTSIIGYSPYYAVPGILSCDPSRFTEISDAAIFRGSSMYPWNNNLSSAELVTLFRFIRILNYCKLEKKDLESFFTMNKFISSAGKKQIEIPVPSAVFLEMLSSKVSAESGKFD